MSSDFAAGDICTYQHPTGTWGFFWILRVDNWPGSQQKIYSLRKFDVDTKEEVKSSHTSDVEELKRLRLHGHFPITEKNFLETKAKVIGHMDVGENDLEGYHIWKTEFDEGRAGVFTLSIEEI